MLTSNANRRSSLILVTVDCLRADHTGFGGYRRSTTPNLDRLAAESFVISNAIVGGTPTYYSFPALLASRPPLALGRGLLGVAPGEVTLPILLQRAGYRTAAFIAGNPYLTSRFGYEQGFDHFWNPLQAVGTIGAEVRDSNSVSNAKHCPSWLNRKIAYAVNRLGFNQTYEEIYFRYSQALLKRQPASMDALRRYPPAEEVVNAALDWVPSHPEWPFFLWLHFMDTHAPFFPPEKALELIGRPDLVARRAGYLNSFWNRELPPERLLSVRDDIIALYDAGLRSIDEQIARLLSALQKATKWQDTVAVFTADHGEEFLEHGGRFHYPTQLGEELIRVPLIIRVPGAAGRRTSLAPFSLLHVAPTLLEILELPPSRTFWGHSHWRRLQNREELNETAIVECIEACNNPFRKNDRFGPRLLAARDSRFKLIVNFRNGTEKLFDWQEDPRELHPSPHNAEVAVRRKLFEAMRVHLQRSAQSDREVRTKAHLRELRLELAA